MDADERNKLLQAGKIAAEVREFARLEAKPGIKLLELANKVEGRIFALGGRPAFPVNLSLNQVAAHYTPPMGDETVFNDNDVLKIDVGVHVDGYIADTACSVGFEDDLIKASREAVEAAVKICRPGTKLCEIGRVIQETIESYEYTPIRNLCGHGLARYELHSGLSIPNYMNDSKVCLKDGDVIAIEPFATTGVGLVKESKLSEIFRVENPKPVRNMDARRLLKFLQDKYSTLPFARRWLSAMPANILNLSILEKEGVVHHYPELREESRGLVSQAEHTVIVDDKPIVTTRKE